MKNRIRLQSGLIAVLALSAVASAQTFRTTGGGGNTFGWGPAACIYDITQSTPVFNSTSCSDNAHIWSGSSATDRGVVYGTSYVDYHELGLWTLGTEYNHDCVVQVNDLVISGPAASSVSVSMNVDLSFESAVDPGGWGGAGASGSAMAQLGGQLFNDQNFTIQGTRRIVVSTSLTPNSPQYVMLLTNVGARAYGPADNGVPHASATVMMHFAIGEPAFIAPPGYAVNCPSLNIVNGYWLGPDQSTIPPMTYGTAKVNSLGCTPRIGSSGTPSASVVAPFLVTADNVLNNKSGLLFYGFAPSNAPFQGGTKLVANPVHRTGLLNSGGNLPPDDCSGAYSFDMNAHIQSGVDANLVAGQEVYCQYWSRDPASASSTGLSDGLAFLIGT